jgi:hypothetical protein
MTTEMESSKHLNDHDQDPQPQAGRFSVSTYHAPSRYKVIDSQTDQKSTGVDKETTEILMADRVATGG